MIINLDIDKQNKTTDYGFHVNPPFQHEVYFRIHDKNYTISPTLISNFKIIATLKLTNTINVIEFKSNDIYEINGEQLFKWRLPNKYVVNLDKISIVPHVNYNGENCILQEFNLIIFKDGKCGMNSILNAIRSFNEMYNEYLKSIKRFEIGQPNGLIPLNEEGKIDNDFLQDELVKHVPYTLYDTLYDNSHIHGLRKNNKTYELEYYDTMDDEWYIANSINGGKFGYANKPSPRYDVFGGLFPNTIEDLIDSGLFTDIVTNAIGNVLFDEDNEIFIDGGKFIDIIPDASGGTFDEKADPIHGGGFN